MLEKLKDNLAIKNICYEMIQSPILKQMYDFIYFKVIRKKSAEFKPKAISIETINVCNLSCIMCPYTKMTREKTIMSMKLYKKIIDDISRSGIKEILLNFYNEPFLDRNIFERIKYAKQKGLIVSFFSNGTIMNKKEINKILKSSLDKIKFSFDGFSKETYEKIRRGANFEKTIQNIISLITRKKELGLKKPKIWIYLVLMDLNKDELQDFKKFWKGKADKVVVGTVDERSEDNLSIKSLKKFFNPYPCPRALDDPTVMADGKMTFCCIDYDGKYIVGDMKKQTFNEIYNSKKYSSIRNLHLQNKGYKIPICKKCSHLYRSSAFGWWGFDR